MSDPGRPDKLKEVDYLFDDAQVARLKKLGRGNAYKGLVIAVYEGRLQDMLAEACQGPKGARQRANP